MDTNGVLIATGGTQSNSNHTVTISGSLASVNADLATLSDTDASAAADTINVSASDSLGNTATPASIAVSVTASAPPGWAAPVSGSWNTAADWNPAAVPTGQANISVAGTYTVTSSQNNSVGSLNITNANATLAIAGASTFTINDQPGSVNEGMIQVGDGSALDLNAGTMTNSGVIAVASATHATSVGILGAVTLNGGGEITLANAQSSIVGFGSGGSALPTSTTPLSGSVRWAMRS